jgi:hypothetical protein
MLALGLTLAACSGDGGGESVGEESVGTTIAASTDAAGEPAYFGNGEPGEEGDLEVDFETAGERRVVRQASLQLHASDTRAAFDEIVAVVESVGGFVADANVFPVADDDDQPTVSLRLRVPADQLNSTMAAVKDSVDEVVSETQGAQDVNEEFVDLEARLTNLEALEVELRALLQEVRMQDNADPEKILRVFNEVSSVRGQIEQIQGRLNYLSDLTSLATLEIGITQTPSGVPIVAEPWSAAEASRGALRSLVAGLQGAADWAISFALFALPMLIITLGPLVVIGVFAYRRFFRRAAPGATPAG